MFWYSSVNWHFPNLISMVSLNEIFSKSFTVCLLISLRAKNQSCAWNVCESWLLEHHWNSFYIFYVVRRFCFRDVLFESKAWSYWIYSKHQQKAFFKIRYFIFFYFGFMNCLYLNKSLRFKLNSLLCQFMRRFCRILRRHVVPLDALIYFLKLFYLEISL